MKKILLFLLLIMGAAALYWFWPGPSPDLPDVSDLDQLVLTEIHAGKTTLEEKEQLILTEPSQLNTFLEELKRGNKTRTSSSNDAPLTSEFVRVELVDKEGQVRVAYLYETDGRTYFEQPYTGIYQMKDGPQKYRELLAD